MAYLESTDDKSYILDKYDSKQMQIFANNVFVYFPSLKHKKLLHKSILVDTCLLVKLIFHL